MNHNFTELFSVKDQVVVVSGGSRGIGRAIAEGFVQNGAKVVVTGREAESLAAAAKDMEGPHPAEPIVCDVASTEDIHRLVDEVFDRHGRVDTLINVAGVNRRKPAEEITEDDYDFVLGINLRGAFFLSQAVGKRMIRQGSGSQINIGSLNNFRPVKGVAPYAVSKAGMGHMTHLLAMEWGPHGVRVNCIAPGFILTDLTKKLWSQQHMLDWVTPNTPLRRLGQPGDMVGTALFLASPASAFMTGQILFVDGGFSSGIAWPIEFDKQ